MSILKNAERPEIIPTYDGLNQATHPSILRFANSWNGYHYWMAMTPYPFSYDGFEDPSVLVSNDAKEWSVPEGLQNPVVPTPRLGHNCDVELVYNNALDELWLYYVEADDIAQSWVKLVCSKDGIHWTEPEIVLHDPVQKYSILSPSIQMMPDGNWRMWYVDTGNSGWQNQTNAVKTRISKNGRIWDVEEKCELKQPGFQIWHLKILYDLDNDSLHAIYPAYPNGTNCDHCKLFYAVKPEGCSWRTFSKPIMEAGMTGSWDDYCLYRTTFLLDHKSDTLRLWYGGKKKYDSSWGIGYTEGQYSKIIKNLKSHFLSGLLTR